MPGLNRSAYRRAAILLLAVALPVAAANAAGASACRNRGGYNPACRNGTAAAGTSTGTYRPYEHWQDGSAAVGSTAPPPQRYAPTYFRGYNSLYGFGR
jgi:hypothetical protein